MEIFNVVGYKKFHSSKKNKDYCVLNLVAEYSDREQQHNNHGSKVLEQFLPDDLYSKVTPDLIGKDIKFMYEVSSGRAFITDFEEV